MKGKIIPIKKAKIPINDWGLIHSDITYDVVPVVDGGFFRLNDYLDRFFASMNSLRLDPRMTKSEIRNALLWMVSVTGLKNSYVAMVCSRGVPEVLGSRDPRHCKNYFYAWCVPYIHVIKPEVVAKGATALISEEVRRISEKSVDPLVKNYHWGDFTKGLFEAKDLNYETVILCDQFENITEGPGFNVFAVKDEMLMTSDHGVLSGITRKTVLEIAKNIGLGIEEKSLKKTEILDADEVFISSSGGGVIPLVRVNSTIFSNGVCGPITKKLRKLI